MDAKLKEDLFRRYVTALEKRLEEGQRRMGAAPEGERGRRRDGEALLSTATALLGAYQPDPGQRFRMVNFYEVVENCLRCQRGSNLRSLEKAFHTLEVICTNLLLFPWKKEFRRIKVSFLERERPRSFFTCELQTLFGAFFFPFSSLYSALCSLCAVPDLHRPLRVLPEVGHS